MREKVLLIGGNSLVGKSIVSGLGDNYQIIRQRDIMFQKTDIN